MLDTVTASRSPAEDQAPPLADLLSSLCKASADPLRLQVLRVLREDSFGVSELCAIFDTSSIWVSKGC